MDVPDLIFSEDLSSNARLLFITLNRFPDGTHPSVRTLTRATGLSKWKLERAREELLKKNIIRYHRGGSIRNGQRQTSRYIILPLNEWQLGKTPDWLLPNQSNLIKRPTKERLYQATESAGIQQFPIEPKINQVSELTDHSQREPDASLSLGGLVSRRQSDNRGSYHAHSTYVRPHIIAYDTVHTPKKASRLFLFAPIRYLIRLYFFIVIYLSDRGKWKQTRQTRPGKDSIS